MKYQMNARDSESAPVNRRQTATTRGPAPLTIPPFL